MSRGDPYAEDPNPGPIIKLILEQDGVLCGPLPSREEPADENDLSMLQHQFGPQIMALLSGLK